LASIFLDIGMIIILAGIMAYAARVLKQPLIPAYIIAGILLGPIFHIITDKAIIDSLSEIGITFLLFSAGLELNLKKLREVGSVATFGALAHMAILFTAGFLIFSFLGYSYMTSMYLGLVLIFSSTLVVVKLLADKREIDTMHGRIIIGILLTQDIVAIIALSLINSMGGAMLSKVVSMFGAGLMILLVGFVIAKMAFSSVFKFAAKNDELLFILSIMVMFSFAIIYSSIGFSIAIGAFIAGLLLGHLPYKFEMISQVKGLKEFFSVIFFVSIGLSLIPVSLERIGFPLIIMLVLMVVFIPLVMMFVLAMFGYKRRTAFLASMSIVQVSEFSLILVRVGLDKGHISPDIFSLTIILALITISFTTYFIKYDDRLYELFGRKLTLFERLSEHNRSHMSYEQEGAKNEVILIGYDRVGYSILQKLRKMKKRVMVIDLNPDIIRKLIEEKIPCIYGDIGDLEIIERLGIEDAQMVISTIPNFQDSMLLLKKVREVNPDATLVLTAYEGDDAMELYRAGADYVIVPHFLGGEHLSFILDGLSADLRKRLSIKVNHMKALEERRKRHPHHH
jgi:Kef-type K+ transport system membrane component KefB/voltage-gated potassium channel Kch